MVAALLIPLVAVTLGTALSVIGGSRPRVLLPIRAFALAAVVASVSLPVPSLALVVPLSGPQARHRAKGAARSVQEENEWVKRIIRGA